MNKIARMIFSTAIVLLSLMWLPSYSQSIGRNLVVSASGEHAEGKYQLTWNLGDIADTFYTENYILETLPTESISPVLGISDAIEIAIYPNPFRDFVNFTLPDQYNEEISILVMDMSGQLIQTKKLKRRSRTVEFSDLKAGFYLVKMLGSKSNHLKTAKMLKLN